MKQRLCRILAAPVAATFLNAMLLPSAVLLPGAVLLPSDAFAQGFEFGEDEAEDFGEPMDFGDDGWEDDGWDDGGVVDDGWGDDTPTTPVTAPVLDPSTVTGIIVPGDALAPALADQLTAVLMTELGNIEGNVVVSNQALQEEFEIMGAELAMECAFDPVCLGRYGRNLGLGRIVVGRVGQTPNGLWGTTIDLFETATSSIVNYRYFETEARTVSVQEAMPSELRQLFGIREQRAVVGPGRTGPSTAQVALAWTTAGLAVGAVATGIVFGLQARSGEGDIDDCNLIDTASGDPVCELTQREARPIIDDARADARLSNIMIGSGLFLGVLSVVLFTVTPGGDIDEAAGLTQRREWRLAPAATRGGFGLNGSLSF